MIIALDIQDFQDIFKAAGFELKIAKYKFVKSEMVNLLQATLKDQRLQIKHLRAIVEGNMDKRGQTDLWKG